MAQVESEIEPDDIADDIGRKSVAFESAHSRSTHPLPLTCQHLGKGSPRGFVHPDSARHGYLCLDFDPILKYRAVLRINMSRGP